MRFRRNRQPHYHDMKTAQPQYVNEQQTTDGERSSVKSSEDGASGSPGGDENERSKLQGKLNAVKEKLKLINLHREGDVVEFLSLTKDAETQRGQDNPQMTRIRQQFEKKNKRHAHETEHLQKKLIAYQQRLNELDNGIGPPDSANRNNMISTVGQGIRRTGANIKGMTETVMAAPMELAHKIKNTFGSADNVNEPQGQNGGDDSRVGHSVFYAGSEHGSNRSSTKKAKSSTLPPGLKMDSAALAAAALQTTPHRPKINNHLLGSGSSHLRTPGHDDSRLMDSYLSSADPFQTALSPPDVSHQQSHHHQEQLMEELRKMHHCLQNMDKKCDHLTTSFKSELVDLTQLLEEERFKSKRLEDLLNETIELHQAEFQSLKQEQKNIANRLDYQYNDRFRSVEETVEAVQNQMCRMENNIHQTLDLRLGGSAWGGNATLLTGVNILVELLKICLYIVATVLDFFRPFTGSRNRAGILLTVLIVLFLTIHYVDFSALFHRSSSLSAGDAPSTATPPPSLPPNTEL